MINRLRLIRRAMHVVKTTGDTEKAYEIISKAFGKEHKTEMLDYASARSKLEAEADTYKEFLDASNCQSERKE